jgi:hypothetical protein
MGSQHRREKCNYQKTHTELALYKPSYKTVAHNLEVKVY